MLKLFGGRGDAVVTDLAGRVDSSVAEQRRPPGDSAVANAAILIRLYVPRRFARRLHAVVAARAAGGDPPVIVAGRQPSERGVTILAGVVARDMGCCFAGRQYPVMTARAVAGYSEV